MSEEGPKRTIYLDLDGVIFPYWHNFHFDIENESEPQSKVKDGMIPLWVNRLEFYFPAITKRLGEMATRGVAILPSSSRSSDLFFDYQSVSESLGGVEKCLVIDKFSPGNIGLKAEAVLNNFQGIVDPTDKQRGWERHRSMIAVPPLVKPLGSKAVWIDDHATIERLQDSDSERAMEILNILSLKIISPYSYDGLTMEELDAIETFLLG